MKIWFNRLHDSKRSAVEVAGPEVTIGRDATCDVVLASPLVSRRHAVLRLNNGRCELENVGLNSCLVGATEVFGGQRLEFSPGVIVIVGPNGSGKSNITDAVLWALGEQSPGAIRGASMQDVISAGGKGVGQRRQAEVEVVIDNSEGRAATELSEISVQRRLDRSGEGEYRLNGARCRLVDVVEVLSDTNLGREMHSVISQGRVESIVADPTTRVPS